MQNAIRIRACHPVQTKIKCPRQFAEQPWDANTLRIRPCSVRANYETSTLVADPSMIRARSEHDPTMTWSSHTHPFAKITCPASELHFDLKNTPFRALSKIHFVRDFKNRAGQIKSSAPATKSNTATSQNTAPATRVTLHRHQSFLSVTFSFCQIFFL